jgi:hypothetical protein
MRFYEFGGNFSLLMYIKVEGELELIIAHLLHGDMD